MASHPHQTRSRRSARLLTSPDDNSLSFDVIQSGPTRTTSTLTPTTLRNIEQTFLEVPESAQPQIPHQAGFVPPFIPFQAPVPQQQQQQQQHLQQQHQLPQQVQLLQQQHQHLHQNTNSSHSYGVDEDEEDMDDDEEIVYTSNNQVPMNRSVGAVMDEDMNSMCSDSMSNTSWPSEKTTTSTPPPPGALNNSGSSSTPAPKRRGGRRPNKQSNLSPEEQSKRCMRRERNKLAAARCRKRRVDHTNELTDEVDGLEKKKQILQSDIKQLQLKKDELEFLLEAHRDHCRLYGRSSSPPDVKPQLQQQMMALAEKIKSEPLDYEACTPPPAINTDSTSSCSTASSSHANSENLLLHNNPLMSSASKRTPTSTGHLGLMMKPNRPSSLAVPFTLTPSQTLAGVRSSDLPGIPIQTPSTGIFNFDSLMDGGTGLTPVAGPLVPTSTGAMAHQRNPMELVTPTSEPAKLVSL